MKNQKTIIIAGTSIIVVGIIFLALSKKKKEVVDYSADNDFMSLIKKIDEAKK